MPKKVFKNSGVTEKYNPLIPFELSVPHSTNDEKLLGCRFNWNLFFPFFFYTLSFRILFFLTYKWFEGVLDWKTFVSGIIVYVLNCYKNKQRLGCSLPITQNV